MGMTWFLIFATTVFGFYFWRQYRARQAELASPTADHRFGLKHIGQVVVLEQPMQNGTGRIRLGTRESNWRRRNSASRGPDGCLTGDPRLSHKRDAIERTADSVGKWTTVKWPPFMVQGPTTKWPVLGPMASNG
jgi:hypothetical protein